MSSAKRKGTRIEREIVTLHEAAGVPCKRVPWSGAIGALHPEFTRLKGDVRVRPDTDHEMVGEVKARAGGSGFKTIERWLGENDLLFLRRDRSKPLVAMPWQTYQKLLLISRTECGTTKKSNSG